MYCAKCGRYLEDNLNFCPYCGQRVSSVYTTSMSLLDKSVSTANDEDIYNLVLVDCGSCSKSDTNDLLEDIFGYSDSEATQLIKMAPVVVGENLTAVEAATVAQVFTEYGVEVSVTNQDDQYIDLSDNAVTSIFDSKGNLLTSIISVIGALTVANRIKRYRRYKKPSLLERLFRIKYRPNPPKYTRFFRPKFNFFEQQPRKTVKKPPVNFNPFGFGQPYNNYKPANNKPAYNQKPQQNNKPSNNKPAYNQKPQQNNKPAANKPSGSHSGSLKDAGKKTLSGNKGRK